MKIVVKDMPLQLGRLGEPTIFGEYWVSPEIFTFAQRNGISDTLELTSWIMTFTEAAAQQLGWSVEWVRLANQILQSEIGAYSWDDITKEYHTGGALPPGMDDHLTAEELALKKQEKENEHHS